VQRRDNFSGRSFYEHIFPADTLAFGWSSSSLHWLSTAPGHIPDRFCVHQSHDSASRIAYAARSTSDWTTFLDHRSVELQVGGVVVIVDVLRGDGGLVGSEALFDCLAGALRAALEQGVLTVPSRIPRAQFRLTTRPRRDAAAKARLLKRIWARTRDLIAAHATSVSTWFARHEHPFAPHDRDSRPANVIRPQLVDS
jgi:hypothetical protein